MFASVIELIYAVVVVTVRMIEVEVVNLLVAVIVVLVGASCSFNVSRRSSKRYISSGSDSSI